MAKGRSPMKEPLSFYRSVKLDDKVDEEQKERIWRKVQQQLEQDFSTSRKPDQTFSPINVNGNDDRPVHGQIQHHETRGRRAWVGATSAAAATIMVVVGGGWLLWTLIPGLGAKAGAQGKGVTAVSPDSTRQNSTLNLQGFTLTPLTTNHVMSPLDIVENSSLASSSGQWMALDMGVDGTDLENMKGQKFQVSKKTLSIEASTPQGGIILGYPAGGASTIASYTPSSPGSVTGTIVQFPQSTDKQSKSTIWARESVTGNWLSLETNEAHYQPGTTEKSWWDINGRQVSALSGIEEAAWSPVDGNLLAALIPIKNNPSLNGVSQGTAYEEFNLATYNLNTHQLTTVVKGIICDVEGGTQSLVSWSPDGSKIVVLTRNGLGVVGVNSKGRAASRLILEKSIVTRYVWLNGNTLLAMDTTTGESSHHFLVYSWSPTNQLQKKSGPTVQGSILDVRPAGTGRAIVETDRGLWLVNSQRAVQVASSHPQNQYWWYDSANGKLYVVPQDSQHIYAKSLVGQLTTGGTHS